MKYLPYLLIALCFLLLLGYTRDLGKEISDLRKEVVALRNSIELCDDRTDRKVQRVIDEVRHIMSDKNFIPVYDWRTFLVYDTEEVIK